MTEPARGVVVPAILLLLGFLVTAAAVEERTREARFRSEAEELLALIENRRATVGQLQAEARTLTSRLGEVQAAGGAVSTELEGLLQQVDGLRAAAGLGPVEGPGLVVELADSADPPRTRGELTDLRIQDVDLRLVVNALWAAGAEAVALNGRRVISTTAIREAGGSIQVNFSSIASPYRVHAVGDADVLRAGLEDAEIARQFDVWTQVYGLGFSIRAVDRLEVPAGETATELTWAEVRT